MSDRYVFHAPKEIVEQQFDVHSQRTDFFESHFNITPGTLIPVVYNDGDQRQLHQFLWGLIPPEADDEREGTKHYDATLDEIREEEWKLECLRERRCLIPALGFYKWKTSKKKTTPFYIRLLADELMAFAGVYRVSVSPSGRQIYSCAMITTEANPLVQPVDDQMPVILNVHDYETWLQEGPLADEKLDELIRTYPMSKMAVNRVSEAVNDTNNNNSGLIQPVPK